MTAPAQTRPTPRPTAGGAGTRLPWWALALPVAAFAVLLTLLVGGGEAVAAGPPEHLIRVLERIRLLLAL